MHRCSSCINLTCLAPPRHQGPHHVESGALPSRKPGPGTSGLGDHGPVKVETAHGWLLTLVGRSQGGLNTWSCSISSLSLASVDRSSSTSRGSGGSRFVAWPWSSGSGIAACKKGSRRESDSRARAPARANRNQPSSLQVASLSKTGFVDWTRERERDRNREIETETEKQRQRSRDRETERERPIHRSRKAWSVQLGKTRHLGNSRQHRFPVGDRVAYQVRSWCQQHRPGSQLWTRLGRLLLRWQRRSKSGQIVVKRRSNRGQTVVKQRSRQTISFIDCSM